MTVKTNLSFTDRHHRYLLEKVCQGVFATRSAAVAAAIASENVTVPFSPLVRQEGGHSCPPLRRGCFRRASVGPELGE